MTPGRNSIKPRSLGVCFLTAQHVPKDDSISIGETLRSLGEGLM